MNNFRRRFTKFLWTGDSLVPTGTVPLDSRGCIFCSAGGSGDFAGDRRLSISAQLDAQIKSIQKKRPVRKFIAYFQAFTNTYAPAARLESLYREALSRPEIVALSVATRPDCLPPPVLELLARLNREKPVWLELGLQTIHPHTASYIRRGYPLSCFEEAVNRLHAAGLDIIVHTILGLPGETEEQMLETVRFLNQLPVRGVKFQLLHVLAGTDLAADYEKGLFRVLTQEGICPASPPLPGGAAARYRRPPPHGGRPQKIVDRTPLELRQTQRLECSAPGNGVKARLAGTSV